MVSYNEKNVNIIINDSNDIEWYDNSCSEPENIFLDECKENYQINK